MLWETAKKKMAVQLHTDYEVGVKRCGRFIITRKSVLYFKSSRKVKKQVTNWQPALNFILIDWVENQSSLFNYHGMK